MDYSLLTEDLFTKRFNSLPEHLQEILESEQTAKLIMQIGKSHYLSREKILTLKQLVALVLLGFLDTRGFRTELTERLYLNFEHATALTNEISAELFNPVKSDLAQIYMPPEEEIAQRNAFGASSFESTFAELSHPAEKPQKQPVPLSSFSGGGVPQAGQGHEEGGSAPLVIHEARGAERGDSQASFKDFSKSFSFFAQKITPKEIQNTPVTAKVEAPKSERVVHYGAFSSSPSAPRGNTFINLEAFGGSTLQQDSGQVSSPQAKSAPSAGSERISPQQSNAAKNPLTETPPQTNASVYASPKSSEKPPQNPEAAKSAAPERGEKDIMKEEVYLEGNTVNLRE